MAVTVPSTDFVNYQIQTEITALGNLVTSNASNGALASSLQQRLQELQAQLVVNLITNALCDAGGNTGGGSVPSRLNASTILATCTINT